MNLKEYFKQQIMESIINEDTFHQRKISKGENAALDKARYFTGLMSNLHKRRGGDLSPNERERVKSMYAAHTGALLDIVPDIGVEHRDSTDQTTRMVDTTTGKTVLASQKSVMSGREKAGHQPGSLRADKYDPEFQELAAWDAYKDADLARYKRRKAVAAARAEGEAAAREKKFTI